VLNVFNLLQWCFDRLSPARLPHFGVNVSLRMAVPDQGFKKTGWLGLKLFCRRDAPALGAELVLPTRLSHTLVFIVSNNLANLLFVQS
jgi:hypothetical protein